MNLMNNVKVRKDELLSCLYNNLDKHQSDVEDAKRLRIDKIERFFNEQLEQIKADRNYQPKENIRFPMPQDNSSEYKKAIKMVEMNQDEIIELSETQFDKLVMDNWGWKEDLIATSSLYGKLIGN